MIIIKKFFQTQVLYTKLWMMKKALIPGQIITEILCFRKKWLKVKNYKLIKNQIDQKEDTIIKKNIKLKKMIINDN